MADDNHEADIGAGRANLSKRPLRRRIVEGTVEYRLEINSGDEDQGSASLRLRCAAIKVATS